MFLSPMRMISRSKTNKGRNRIIALAVVIILLVALSVTGLFSKGFYRTMVFFSGSTAGAGNAASSFFSIFSSKSALEKENDNLKKLLKEYEVKLSDKELLIKENADLKAAQHLSTDTGNVSANLLSKPPFTPFDVVVVDAGTNQGVEKGNAVMIGRIYLGVVSEVFDTFSRVTLLSAPGNSHEAYVGDEALPVILNGKGGGNFETSLPQGSNVKEGDLVITYYNETPYQIGRVSKIIDTEDNTRMTILLGIPFNLYSLNHVEIIPS